MNLKYYTYVLRNPKGILYKGFSSCLNDRVLKHNANDGFKSYTSKRGSWKLIYYEEFDNEKEARQRERFFKSGKGREFLKKKLGDYPPKADG